MEFCKDLTSKVAAVDGVVTIDSHTAGELTRLIVGGTVPLPGETMIQKLTYFQQHYDEIRKLLMREPRGCGGMAAMVTEPVSQDAQFGLFYMDGRRYPFLCGHATIGAVVSLAWSGFLDLQEGENLVTVDTPSGPMPTTASVRAGTLESVSLNMVPSFVFQRNQNIEVPGFGTVSVDLVCVGGFFAMVAAEELGIEAVLENRSQLIPLGMKIIAAANQQVTVSHPERPEVKSIDVVEFYDAYPTAGDDAGTMAGRSVVVYGESHLDRSPCGTGTAAKLTLLHRAGKICLGQPYTNYSPVGTRFDAKIVQETTVGECDAVVVRISGMAHITGTHTFFVEHDDPFPQGFVV